MSKQIDERVVSMQFDNRHFESNVQTSISTLDKLKRALHLDGATKSLENVGAAAKNVNISHLGSSVETVSAKFSALQVMGVTALANITNSAVNAGKRLAAAFTITPIKTGFNEYELKMGSIQTIMASTGESLETVNKHLDELNKYSDQTIYSFQDMTSNIGKFTNAGVKLEDAVLAIKGISNEAAVSGANANEASRAMYNFAQALSSGYVKLIDWKSIELANMATVEFKEQLIATAVEVGTLKKTTDGYVTSKGTAITATKNFNDSLKDEWMTSEVLISTLKDYADETTDIGKKASKAATEVKTFSQLMDTLKESVQSGWAKTWEIIIGDYDEAKNLFTMISNVVGGFLDKISDARNKLLGGIMSYNPLSALTEKIDKSGIGKIKETTKALTDLTDKVEYYRDIVNKVWRGDYKNAPVRYELLEKAGYNPKVVQNLVNKGYDQRNKITEEDIAKAYKDAGVAMEEVTEKSVGLDKALENLNDEELKNLGFNADEIKMLRDLQAEAKRLNVPIDELLKKMEKKDGRTLLLDSFKNIGSGLVGVFKALGEAWSNIFPAPSVARIYTLIDAFNQFTQKLRLTDEKTGELNENGDKLKRTFEGVFALLDIITTIIGGPVKITLKLIGQLLGAFDLNILDLTAIIGDAIVRFRDWLDSVLDFTGVFKKIAPYVQKAIDAVKKWFDTFKPFEKIAEVFKKATDAVKKWFDEIKLFEKVSGWFKNAGDAIEKFADRVKNSDIVKNILSGLGNGLKDGAKTVWEWMKNLGKRILDGIKSVLGIHSPSTEFFEIGKNIIAGLINGIKAGFSAIGTTMKELGGKIVEAFKGLDMSKLSSLFMNIVKIFPQLKILNVFSGLAGIFSSLGENVSSGLVGGLGKSASAVWDAITKIASGLIDAFKNVLGIHSPSKVFFAIGGFIIAGLLGGLIGGTADIKGALSNIGQIFVDFFKNLDLGKIAAVGSIVGIFLTIKKVLGIADKFANAAEGFGKLGKSLSGLVDTINNGFIGKFQKSKWTIISEAILKVAIAIGILVGSVVILTKVDPERLWPAFGALAAIMGLVVALAGIMAGMDVLLTKFGKGDNMDRVTKLISKMVGVLLAMVIVAKIAATMSWDDLARAGVAFLGMGAIIAGLLWATQLVAKGGVGSTIDMFGVLVKKIAGAMLMLVIVAKIAASMSWDDLARAGVAFIGLGGILVGLMATTKLANTWKSDSLGKALLSIAGAMLLMVIVAKIAASMSPGEMLQGGLAIVAFGGILVGLMAATKLIAGGKDIAAMGKTLLMASAAIGIMMLTAKLAASMSPGEMLQGGLAVLAFSGIIVGLMAATRLIAGGKAEEMKQIGVTLISVAAAIGIMMLTAKLAASMSPGEMLQGGLAVLAFSGIIVGLMAATKLIAGGKASEMNAMMKTLLGVAAVIAAMALSVALLSLLDPGKMWGATAAVGILVGVFALVLKAASSVQKGMGVLTIMTIAVAALGTVLIILSHSPIEQSLAAAGALSAVLLAMSLAFTIIAKSASNVQKGMGVLIVMTIAVAAIGTILLLLAQQPWQQSLAAAGALSTLLLVLTGVVTILSTVSTNLKNVTLGVVGLLALCVPLLALVGILALMQNVQNATTNALVLAGLATVLTALLIPLSLVGLLYTATGGMAMLGIVGLLAMCVPLLALVGILALMQNIQNAAENTKLLTTLMTTMTGMLVVLAIVGPLALVGVAAMAGLTGLIVAIGALAVGIGYLMQQFPALQSFLDTGIPIMIQLAGGIGEMIGAFIGGIAERLAATLPGIGLSLSQFMINATPFIMGAKLVDETVLKGVGILAASVLALTAADLIEGVVSFLNGGSSFATLGTELSNFMMNAMPFITGSKLIDPEIMTGVKTLAEAILILCGSNMLETITSWLGGESSLSTFGSQLGQLGTDLSTFVTNLGTFDEKTVMTIDCAGRAIKALAEAAATIPNDGGLWGAIVGENSLSTFSTELPKLGTNLGLFITNLGKFDEGTVTKVDCAGRAIKALAEAAGTIPNDGGLWGAIVGENSLSTFSAELPKLGTNLGLFITNLGTFDEKSIATVDCAGKAIKALAEAAKTIPNEGGFWAKIVGDNSLATFGGHLPKLGENIASFVSNLGEFGADKIATVDAACKTIKSIAKLGEINISDTSSGLDKLGKKLEGFAKKIKSFVDKVGEVGGDSITSAINKTKDLIDLAKTAAGTNVDSLKTFGESLKKVATEGVKGFVKEFTGESPKSQVQKAAKDLLDKFIKGAESKEKDVTSAFQDIAEAASKKVATKTIKEAFKTAGKDLVEGFASGIENNKSLATDAGSALGKAALKAAKEALDENSPSKEMYKVGDFAGIGFVNALIDNVSNAYSAGYDVADSAKTGLSKAIAKISDFVNSDIDAQPTIRPVLDLSDVQAGASTIGGMFSGRTLSVNARTAGIVSASMAGRQNGDGSSDIVSAIKALRKDISDMPRETTNINGITYSGDSEINDAIQVLVRAAKVGGRS